MEAYNGSVIVPKFDGSNYMNWSQRMRSLFIARDMWDLVLNGYTTHVLVDPIVGLTKKQHKKLKELENRDNETISLIFLALEEHFFTRVSDVEISKEAWDTLKTFYEGATTARLQTLRRNFETFRMNTLDSVNDFTTKV